MTDPIDIEAVRQGWEKSMLSEHKRSVWAGRNARKMIDELEAARKRIAELKAALVTATIGCASAIGVANNRQWFDLDPLSRGGALAGMVMDSLDEDARAGYRAACSALECESK